MVPLIGLFMLALSQFLSAQPYTVTFYVPLPEGNIRTNLESLNSATGNDITTIISIVTMEGNAVIVYDHWEDGYEADINNPVQASTLVFGDNNMANGDLATAPPGASCFPVCPIGDMPLPSGLILTLKNTMNANPSRGNSPIRFDGKDRISSNRGLSVARAAWSPTPGSVLAGAVEVPDTMAYGLAYVAPVGQNTAGQNSMFERTDAYIMASQNGTMVTIDVNGPGMPGGISNVTLNQGENHTVTGVLEGATFMATKPVQVHLLTGDVGASYETRWFTLYPVDFAAKSYYNPVSSASAGDPTSVFLYNPGNSAITVNYMTLSGSGMINVPAMASARFDMPVNSGGKFTSANNFFALAIIDSDAGNNLTHDWGFSLLPESYLTSAVIVGWGPGADDLSGPPGPDANYSPVWVTSATPTTVYVDWDGNPATGANTDPNGNKYDQAFNVVAFQVLKLYDTFQNDNDQTGARIYTVDGTRLAVAWGQDPAVAVAGNPALDVGTAVSPGLVLDAFKTAEIADLDSDNLLDDGEKIIYRIVVKNLSQRKASAVMVEDIIPANTAYVPGTTKRFSTDPAFHNISIPDDGVGTPFPLDEGGIVLMNVEGDQSDTIEFQMMAMFPPPPYPTKITNSASVISNGNQFYPKVDVPVDNNFTGCTMAFNAANYAENAVLGITVTIPYLTGAGTVNIKVENTTNGDMETVTLTEGASGVYSGTLPTSTSSGGSNEDGTLLAQVGHSITATYTNNFYNNSCSDNASVVPPTEIKSLYLSGTGAPPGQFLDRVNPADPVDNTLATVTLGGGGAGAISFDAATSAQEDDGGSLSWNHTVAANANRILMVGVTIGGDDTGGGLDNVTSVTYGGQSLSLVPGSRVSEAGEIQTELWYLLNPNTGTNSVTVTLANNNHSIVGGAVSYYGVNQTTPLGTAGTTSGETGSPISQAVTTVAGQRLFSVLGYDSSPGISVTGVGHTSRWNQEVEPNDCNCNTGVGSDKTATGASTTLNYDSDEDQDYAWAWVPINPAPAGATTVTFTQSPTMCNNFDLIAGTTITAHLYLANVGGTINSASDIEAVLKVNGSTVANLNNPPSYSGGILVLTGTVISNTTVLNGQAISLDVINNEAFTFDIRYDEQNNPSRIDIPTTTVISIENLAVYDAPYPGGSAITEATNADQVYVRVVVSDPFGYDDITALDVDISGPSGYTHSASAASVATAGCTRTYEYCWQTPPNPEGDFDIEVETKEGTENAVVDAAVTTINLSKDDLGAPCEINLFTSNTYTTTTTSYNPNAVVYIQVNDADEDENTGSPDMIGVVVTSSSGDMVTVTLTETGNSTGVFRGSVSTDAVGPVNTGNGILEAGPGVQIEATYTDNDQSLDVCPVTAAINSPTPALSLTKTRTSPVAPDNIALVGETVVFQIAVSNTGPTEIDQLTLTDTYNPAQLGFISASLTPDVQAAGSLTWNSATYGFLPIPAGQSRTIILTFTALAPATPATNSAATTNGEDYLGASVPNKNSAADVNITKPEVTVAKTRQGPSPVDVGTQVTYLIEIENTGSTAIELLPFVDNYSDFCLSYASTTSSVAPSSAGGGVIIWNDLLPGAATLAPGNTISFTVTFDTDAGCDNTPNTALATSVEDVNGDPVPDSQDAAEVTILDAADLRLEKSVNDATPAVGATVTFTLTVYNDGPVAATNVAVTDVLPGGYTYVGSSMTGGTTQNEAGAPNLVWTIANIPDGGNVVLTFQATVDAPTATPNAYKNTAQVTASDRVDPDSSPNNDDGDQSEDDEASASVCPECSVSGPATVCANTTGHQYNGPAGWGTYNWSVSGNGSINGATDGQSVSIDAGAAGTYTVTLTVSFGGCTSTCSQTVTVNSLPAPSISGELSFCAGSSTMLAASGGASYAWSTGANTASINVNAAGTYTVTVTGASGCTATASATVTVKPLPTPSISGDLSFCAGGSTMLTASGGASYAWSTGANTATITVGAAGTYTVTVTGANGCTASTSATVTENSLPTPSISGELSFCTGSSTMLTASGGASYAWSTGANTALIIVNAAGIYTVTVTNANGCTATTSATVMEKALPTPSISGELSFCAGSSTMLTASGGASYNWITGANTASITVGAAGTYTVTVTAANGCTAKTSATVTVKPLPTPSISGDLSFCAGANTMLTASGGSSYAWSNGAMTAATTVSAPGTYTVTVTGANGCTATTTAAVTEIPQPSCAISDAMTEVCPNSPGNQYSTPMGMDNYAWSISGNGSIQGATDGPSISVTAGASGTYTVSVAISKNGCTASCSKTVQITSNPFMIVFAPQYCIDDPGPVIGLNGSEVGASYQLQTGAGANLGAPVAGTGSPIVFGAYPNGSYKVVITGGTCDGVLTKTVNAAVGGCTIGVPDFCSCDAPGGFTPVVIKVNAPDGQNWEVKAVTGLYSGTGPYVHLAIGTALTPIGGNMYTLEASRANDKGYWIQLTNGFTDLDIMVGNPSW